MYKRFWAAIGTNLLLFISFVCIVKALFKGMGMNVVWGMILQAAVATAPGTASVPLWQSVREEMSPEEVASSLRSVDGIKSVAYKIGKKGPTFSIRYVDAGVEISGIPFSVEPKFEQGRLVKINLNAKSCAKLIDAKYEIISDLLSQKYAKGREQREISEDGTFIAIRNTFISESTRVMMRVEQGDIPQYVPPKTGLAGLMTTLINNGVDADRRECPNDTGRKSELKLVYSGQASSAATDNMNDGEQEAKEARDKSKL